ncbi:UNVERIFIED_CONTAM: hypothetical protein HDU68_008805 [Siphonaria sp. JEL0065]|nr:hypothetical protein HDU68_008805 [Siphonaria sp. JEL0065]
MTSSQPTEPVSLWGKGYNEGYAPTAPEGSVTACSPDDNDDIEDMAHSFELLESEESQKDIDMEHIRRHPVVDSSAIEPEEQEEDTVIQPVQSESHFLPGNAKVWVKTMGCSHNVSDGEYMAGLLTSQGYSVLFEDSKKDQADLWLLNSCTVKGPSELTFINDIKKGMDAGKKVVVAGCVPQASGTVGGSIGRGKGKGREWDGLSVVGVQQIDRVVEVVEETLKGNVIRLTKDKKVEVSVDGEEAGVEKEEEETYGVQRSSAKKRKAGGAKLDLPKVRRNPYVEIISINTGCLNQCTYCKTKHARGDLGSYSPAEIWERCESVIQEGVKEIWLTSEDTGAYGRDIGVSIVDLLWGIVKVLERYPKSGTMLRVGMTNPPYILEHLSEMVKILSHPRVFSFLHVPVQSGSNAVLDSMRRQYTVQEFTQIVTTLRSQVQPTSCTVATDIICGFPTETDNDFEESMDLLRLLQFNVLHISQFYSRPGTPAALMPRLPSEVVKARSRLVSQLFNEWFPYQGLEGLIVDALVTEVSSDGKFYVGHDKLYRQILVPKVEKYLGRWVRVEVVRTGKFFLEGKVLELIGGEVEELDDFGIVNAGNVEEGAAKSKPGKGMVVKRKRAPKLVNVAGKMVKMESEDGGTDSAAGEVNDEGTELSVPESFQKLKQATSEVKDSAADDVAKRWLTPHVSVGLGLVALVYGGLRVAAVKNIGPRMIGAGLIVVGGLGLVGSGLFELRTKRS